MFNAATSTIWCRIRDLFQKELTEEYNKVNDLWNANTLINQFETWQNQFPEELWMLDVRRKYIRPISGTIKSDVGGNIVYYPDHSPTSSYVEMLNGRKRYQRRQWERDQEAYMASKYQTLENTSDEIWFRCGIPPKNAAVKANYTLHITPYSSMYINVAFGNSTPTHIKAKAGVETIITPSNVDENNANELLVSIRGGSHIQSLGDLSPIYIHSNNFSRGIHLIDLIVGNHTEGYENTALENLNLGSLSLLTTLNIENLPSLTTALDLSKFHNLKYLYAKGSAISGVTFASNGLIQRAELPAVNTLIMRSLHYLTNDNLVLDAYNKLTGLIIESCSSLSAQTIIEAATALTGIRAMNVALNLKDETLLERLYGLTGYDADGKYYASSVLSGKATLSKIHEFNLNKYQAHWKNLVISIPQDAIIKQVSVTFYNGVNDGGSPIPLVTIPYEVGQTPVNPYDAEAMTALGLEKYIIEKPTKEQTIKETYTFKGWDRAFSPLAYSTSGVAYNAVYTSTPRLYTVTYRNDKNNVDLQVTTSVPYGAYVPYTGVSGTYNSAMGDTKLTGVAYAEAVKSAIPTYTALENASNTFYLFKGWDKSGYCNGYVNGVSGEIGDKIINTTWDSLTYTQKSDGTDNFSTLQDGKVVYKRINEMSPIEIYAMNRLAQNGVQPFYYSGTGDTLSLNNNDGVNDDNDIIAITDNFAIQMGNDVDYDDVKSHTFISLDKPLTLNGNNCLDLSTITAQQEYANVLNVDSSWTFAIEFKIKSPIGTIMSSFTERQYTGIKLMADSNGSVYYNSQGANAVGFVKLSTSNSNSVDTRYLRQVVVLRHTKGEKLIHVYGTNLGNANVMVKVAKDTSTGSAISTTPLVFGASKNISDISAPYSSYATGTIYWAKVWFEDLGDSVAKDLASWNHETISFKVARAKSYYKTDGNVSFVFLADTLLDEDVPLGSTDYSTSSLNTYLNQRIYNAFPVEWKAIMAETILPCWSGAKKGSNNYAPDWVIRTSDFTNIKQFIFIPSIYELRSENATITDESGRAQAGENLYLLETGPTNEMRGQFAFASASDALASNYIETSTPGWYWTRSRAYDGLDNVWIINYTRSQDASATVNWGDSRFESPNEGGVAVRIEFAI